jgi:hypothetical protein
VGTAPLGYQWKKNGTPITGAAAAAYTTPAVAAADNGAGFTVVVANGAGHVESRAALLTVPTAGGASYLQAYLSDASLGTPGLAAGFTVTQWGSLAAPKDSQAPGRPNQLALETTFGSADGWAAVGLAHRQDWNSIVPLFLNQFRTIEFDILFASDSTGDDNLTFILEDAGHSTEPALTSLIPGWSGLTASQKHGAWFHVTADLAALKPDVTSFEQFLLFNAHDAAGSRPHFYLADVKLGWVQDTQAPRLTFGSASVDTTYTQASLTFTTDEPCLYGVEYGPTTAYGRTVAGGTASGDYAESFQAALTALTPGSACCYRITVSDHPYPASATPNRTVLAGTFPVPALPTAAPVISGLSVTAADSVSATLGWTTDRPCTASVSYQKAGGTPLTRTLTDLAATRTLVLDLLEPSTAYTVTVTATDAFAKVSDPKSIVATTTALAAADVTITVDPASARAISPYIYGLNFSAGIKDAPPGITFDRAGGNRWTAYNWENNASNAGSDYLYESDAYLSSSTVPGEAARALIASDRSRGQASLQTLQLQGYVAADENGPVPRPFPNLARFKQVAPAKAAVSAQPFTTTPSLGDAFVCMDEFAWALDQKIPGLFAAKAALPTFISLDNEPELWNSTHEEIQGTRGVTSDAYIAATVALAKALKTPFPDMVLFGPVHYGFNGIVNWQGELASTPAGNDWFTNKFLAALKAASATFGRRLLDVYDFHWYSEARSADTDKRISDLTGASLTAGEVQAIVQSPRSLWDPTYTEKSWVADWLGGAVQLLPRLQSRIDASWPGTLMGITEYESGGDNHIAGTLAQADNLGIFADRGVFAATWWPPNGTYPYTVGAFRAYRGFDGAGANFGDTALATVSSSIDNVSVHASRDSAVPGRIVFVVINRSTSSLEVALTGLPLAGTARVYRITAASAAAQVAAKTPVAPVLAGQVPASGTSLTLVLPALSVSTVEIR